MSIKNLQSILKQREAQYGVQPKQEEVNLDDKFETLFEAIRTLADNQQKLYAKLEEIDSKLGE